MLYSAVLARLGPTPAASIASRTFSRKPMSVSGTQTWSASYAVAGRIALTSSR
jgi:hypothetical protein